MFILLTFPYGTQIPAVVWRVRSVQGPAIISVLDFYCKSLSQNKSGKALKGIKCCYNACKISVDMPSLAIKYNSSVTSLLCAQGDAFKGAQRLKKTWSFLWFFLIQRLLTASEAVSAKTYLLEHKLAWLLRFAGPLPQRRSADGATSGGCGIPYWALSFQAK